MILSRIIGSLTFFLSIYQQQVPLEVMDLMDLTAD